MYDKKMQLWDKKSKTFPRYSEELSAVQKGAFAACKSWSVEFAGKSLIDIGCGTGVWTLHLAKMAKSVSALDASQGMLKVLKEDASRLNLGNVSVINSNFECFYKDFDKKNSDKFDIAFSSMSPALNKDEDYKAFMALAPLRVFVGWEEYRQSDLLAPIFKAFNAKQKCFDDNDMENFLRKNKIEFKKKVFEETRHNEKPREIAIENALWHLNMAGIEPSVDELDKLIKGGTIKEVVKSKIKLLVF